MSGVGARGAVWGRAVVVAVVLGLVAAVARPVESLAAGNVELAAAKAQPRGSIYLFLGLFNVFSTGLDTLSDELKAKGVPNTAMNYAGWMGPAAEIEARWAQDRRRTRPIVLVGHSFGADAAMRHGGGSGQEEHPGRSRRDLRRHGAPAGAGQCAPPDQLLRRDRRRRKEAARPARASTASSRTSTSTSCTRGHRPSQHREAAEPSTSASSREVLRLYGRARWVSSRRRRRG